jgi:hypothetical protein
VLTIQSKVYVEGLTGREVTDFLIDCDDAAYQAWWPGTHLASHTVKRVPGDVGNVVYMDEYVGKYRIKMSAVVTEFEPGKRFACRMKKGILLPGWLYLDFVDDDEGVAITHTLEIGYPGAGKILDPLLRLRFSAQFEREMDEHARTEFPKLGELLRGQEQGR